MTRNPSDPYVQLPSLVSEPEKREWKMTPWDLILWTITIGVCIVILGVAASIVWSFFK